MTSTHTVPEVQLTAGTVEGGPATSTWEPRGIAAVPVRRGKRPAEAPVAPRAPPLVALLAKHKQWNPPRLLGL
jgi:hypothetical protein